MEFLKTIQRRSFLSEVVYIVLNITFAVAILLIIHTTGSMVPALLLVAFSKWRVFAVRPRFWAANVKANLVDFIVSLSVVVFLLSIDGTVLQGLIAQIIITFLYVVWLVIIKPRSTKRAIALQAGVSLAAGVSALFMVSHSAPVVVIVIGMWVIGFVTARHILVQYEEDQTTLLSLIWGLVLAQTGWIAYHWTIAYSVPFVSTISIPQVTISTTILGFIAYKVYVSQKRHETVRGADVVLPIVFGVSVIAVLLLLFNQVGIGTI